MLKIIRNSFLIITVLLLFSCMNDDKINSCKSSEEVITYMKENNIDPDLFKSGIIIKDCLYFGSEYKISRELVFYDSIEESLKNIPYAGQTSRPITNIKKVIHIFEYYDNMLELVVLEHDENKGIDRIHNFTLPTKDVNGITKYSTSDISRDIIILDKPVSIEECWNTSPMNIGRSTIALPIEKGKAQNRVFCYTSDPTDLPNLRVEGQKIDGIVEFESNGIDYYFWYINDLKSNKNPKDYKISFK